MVEDFRFAKLFIATLDELQLNTYGPDAMCERRRISYSLIPVCLLDTVA